MSACGVSQPFMPWTAAANSLTHRQLTSLRPLPAPPCLFTYPSSTSTVGRRFLPRSALAQVPATTAADSHTTEHGSSNTCSSYSTDFDVQRSSSEPNGVYAVAAKGAMRVDSSISSPIDRSISPSGLGPPGDGDDEFAVNYGEAVCVLREDLPCLFERDPRFHIFREDLTFRTPSLRYSTGLWKYRLLHRAARYLGNLLYTDMNTHLTRMWTPAGNKRQLRVRWCVSGRPRLSLSADDPPQSTEVISTYTFDSHGKIYEHQVDNIIPPESMLVRLFEWLVGQLQPGMVPQPQLPLPGLRDGMS